VFIREFPELFFESKTVFLSFLELDVSDYRKGVDVTPENSFVFFISEFV
jgi:hypothetical protein